MENCFHYEKERNQLKMDINSRCIGCLQPEKLIKMAKTSGSWRIVLSSHLMVVIPEADADGAAGPGQDSCHSV